MNDTGDPDARRRHSRAWESLAAAIAADAAHPGDVPPHPPACGELTIIGSGIETVGFGLSDENLLRSADEVFYCVADPGTAVWIRSVRPDAYDLYVLYDDSKPRYTTYMQMSEAILHFVRRGKRVVAVYYGHPGIFVLSTHRCVTIARREGHLATMRPAVSALDCLCADLGVDPCHPGMQTHEATDMLIRGRKPDPSLHVVLWQVGLIGEMGFRRRGYLNANLPVLVDYLTACYGGSHPLVHYVASRYPTIPPVIEHYTLDGLRNPRLHPRFTGISTWYLPPRDPVQAVPETLLRLGLARPGQTLRTDHSPLRDVGSYGPREMKAVRALRSFRVPRGYHWQPDTGAARFLIALRHDPALRERYRSHPAAATESFPGLTVQDRLLLSKRDAGAIQLAAKGNETSERNQALLRDLYADRRLASRFLAALRSDNAASAEMAVDWPRMRADVDRVLRTSLFAWTGLYQTQGDAPFLIAILADGRHPRLAVDGAFVRTARFRHGVLHWSSGSGQALHGLLRPDVDANGRRRLIGFVWRDGSSRREVVAVEAQPGRRHAAGWIGDFRRKDDGSVLTIGVSGERMCASVDGTVLHGAVIADGAAILAGDRSFRIGSVDPRGEWMPVDALPPELAVSYNATAADGRAFMLHVSPAGVSWNGAVLTASRVTRRRVSWTDGPAGFEQGELTLVVDPMTLDPALFGSVGQGNGAGTKCTGVARRHLARDAAEFGLRGNAWRQAVDLANTPPGLLLWHRWEKANLASIVVNVFLARVLS